MPTPRPKRAPAGYRSSARDEGPYLPNDFNIFDPPQPGPMDVDYRSDGPALSEIFDSACEGNVRELGQAMKGDFEYVGAQLDRLYSLASLYIPNLLSPVRAELNPSTQILIPCFHKSLLSLVTAFDLTKRGLYGPGRPLLRHAFESLMIAKFCSVNHESGVFDKWMDGYDIWLSSDVFDNLASPQTDALRMFWRDLSGYTHSTVYASQPTLRATDAVSAHAVGLNTVFLAMLIECMYHLLSTHIATRSVRWYQDFYGDGEVARETSQRLKSQMTLRRRAMTQGARRLVLDYRARWVIQA